MNQPWIYMCSPSLSHLPKVAFLTSSVLNLITQFYQTARHFFLSSAPSFLSFVFLSPSLSLLPREPHPWQLRQTRLSDFTSFSFSFPFLPLSSFPSSSSSFFFFLLLPVCIGVTLEHLLCARDQGTYERCKVDLPSLSTEDRWGSRQRKVLWKSKGLVAQRMEVCSERGRTGGQTRRFRRSDNPWILEMEWGCSGTRQW